MGRNVKIGFDCIVDMLNCIIRFGIFSLTILICERVKDSETVAVAITVVDLVEHMHTQTGFNCDFRLI